MKDNLYHYKALITDVESTDTCLAYLDLGFGIVLTGTVLKLNRISGPKAKGASAKLAAKGKKFLRSLVLNKDVTVETIKDGEDFLAELWIYDKTKKRVNINDLLVEQGVANYKK
jgi:endonuclease YncB( thermonuclease family)